MSPPAAFATGNQLLDKKLGGSREKLTRLVRPDGDSAENIREIIRIEAT
jgi:hypothetical protein